MAGKFSIYKYVKLAGKGWWYARAAYHPNGKIKPDAVLVKGVDGKDVEEKHPEGSYVLNFNNKWIPVASRTECWTLDTTEFPSDVGEFSLSDISAVLETTVPSRYFF